MGTPARAGPASIAQVELRLAGTFRVVRDGTELTDAEIGSRKSRTLLKLLAVRRPALVPADQIIEVRWPAGPPATPEQNVATLVSRLRAALGADLIQGGRTGYRLASGPGIVVDLDVAAGFCEAAEGKMGSAAAVALAAAQRAHELLAEGTVIDDEPYADWADPARERVRALLRRARLAAAEAALATGDPRLAAGFAEAAIAADPLDEAAHRWCMSASAAAGEQAKALAAYESLRQRLGRELGADPAPQTRELHLAILREQDGGRDGRPAGRDDQPGGNMGAAGGRRDLAHGTPLAGRDGEMSVLRQAWGLAAGDRRLEMLALYELGADITVQRGLPIGHYMSNLENGLHIARSLGDRASEANMGSRLAIIAANRLRLDAALDQGLQGVAAGRAATDDHALAAGLDGLKTVYVNLGDISALTRVLAELIPLLHRLREPFLLQWAEFESVFPAIAAWYVAHQGWLARLRGRTEEAIIRGHKAAATGSRAMLNEATGLLEHASIPDGGAWMLGYEAYLSLADAWLAHGEPDRARAVLVPLLAVADREPWLPALTAALAADGRALTRLGQDEQARTQLDRAAGLAGRYGMPHVLRDARETLGRLPS